MAEALKGEVDFDFEGDTYTFRFGGSAMMAIEAAFGGRSFIAVLRDLASRDTQIGTPIADVAKLVHAGLRWHHPHVSIDEAAEMAGLDSVQVAMGEAIDLSFPKPAGGDGNADAHPTKPARSRRGTGTKSLASGSKRGDRRPVSAGPRRT